MRVDLTTYGHLHGHRTGRLYPMPRQLSLPSLAVALRASVRQRASCKDSPSRVPEAAGV